MKIALDGRTAGYYRGDCECGFSWTGQAEVTLIGAFNPTMAIAETVVHLKMAHEGSALELRFTERFERWLFKYWQASGRHWEIAAGRMTR